ncbi:hypothetical protein PVAG01_03022 [Phlyctema vagabunda]|uniref:Uncharacterized protein n=1 Tax=Phlyctema vagabunda TaxID=108571 RepID=A0ABR4PTN6_9HELO
MGNLIDLIQQKLELFRLEQRYTRRRNRRSTFVSEAQYVDGEYIYAPTSTYSAQVTGGSSSSGSTGSEESIESAPAREEKKSRRMSKMGMGSLDWRQGKGTSSTREERRKNSRVSVREIKWDGGVRT